MILKFIAILFTSAYSCETFETKRYDNYTLFRTNPITTMQLEFLKSVPSSYKVMFWIEPSVLGKPVDLIISPQNRTRFEEDAQTIGLFLAETLPDVQKSFDEISVSRYTRRNTDTFNWDSFFKIESIFGWMKDMAREHSPNLRVQSIGVSHLKRDILVGIVILQGSLRRSKVIIEGGIHGKEWMSPAFVTFMMDQIVNAPTSNKKQLRRIALTYEWYFIPVVNPDGYEYSFTYDRLWKKNCNNLGVDLNRNFEHKFSAFASEDPLNEAYGGENAFSEKESIVLRDFLLKHSEGLEFYLSIHAYGQHMTIPYAYTNAHMDNYDEVKKIATNGANVINKRLKTKYKVGTHHEIHGNFISGTSTDWIKYTLKVPFVLTIAIHDSEDLGFAIPIDKIEPNCEGIFKGVLKILEPKTSPFLALKSRYERNLMKNESLQHFRTVTKSSCLAVSDNFIVTICFILYCF